MLLRIGKGYEDLLQECCRPGAPSGCLSRGVGVSGPWGSSQHMEGVRHVTPSLKSQHPCSRATAQQILQCLTDSQMRKAPTEPSVVKQFNMDGGKGMGLTLPLLLALLPFELLTNAPPKCKKYLRLLSEIRTVAL